MRLTLLARHPPHCLNTLVIRCPSYCQFALAMCGKEFSKVIAELVHEGVARCGDEGVGCADSCLFFDAESHESFLSKGRFHCTCEWVSSILRLTGAIHKFTFGSALVRIAHMLRCVVGSVARIPYCIPHMRNARRQERVQLLVHRG